ncbi:Protein roadkill [Orchesella cincta]|uniref:Protein roadkill n=1 Tax=Orchesella cincta TaxID=48709 RepID=A0A1D2M1M2_ORCCI|nr:Protein roadkill [Orchesella cincta]
MASRPAKRSRSNDDEPESSMGETDVDQDVFSFVWTINNYSTQLELGAVESPVFAEVQRTTTAGGPGMEIIRFSRLNGKWGYDDFAPADLLNASPNLAVDDKVKILCKIWIYGDSKKTVMKFRGAKFNPSHEDRFRMSKDGIVNDLGKLFKESIGTDVTISGSKTNFKAHKLILSARSTVFAAMFNSECSRIVRTLWKLRILKMTL